MPRVACQIRKEEGVQVEEEEQQQQTRYGQNFWGRFCTCEALYEPEKEKGVMWQCLLGDVCQEDWFHDTCLVGRDPPGYVLGREEGQDETKDADKEEEEDEDEKRLRDLGFPPDDAFEHMICWRCLSANPWLKRLAAYPGFFVLERKEATADTATVAVDGSPPAAISETPAVDDIAETTKKATEATEAKPEEETAQLSQGQKRKASDSDEVDDAASPLKRVHPDLEPTTITTTTTTATTATACTLPPSSALPGTFTLLLPSDFRARLCHCPDCYPYLRPFPQLREAEESHEPPVSPPASIYDESERALNSMDRVQAIEGVLAYNKLKERVKAFLEPFAKSGRAVAEEDVKGYFEGLREREREGGGAN
jgi:E3 ubiquitin-protein ligase UBR7